MGGLLHSRAILFGKEFRQKLLASGTIYLFYIWNRHAEMIWLVHPSTNTTQHNTKLKHLKKKSTERCSCTLSESFVTGSDPRKKRKFTQVHFKVPDSIVVRKENEGVVLIQTHNVNMAVLHPRVSSHFNGHLVSEGIKPMKRTFARHLEVQLFA